MSRMTFREFADNIKGACANQVGLITGERDVLPFVHFVRDDNVHGIAVAGAWFDSGETRRLMDQLVLPYADIYKPEYVAWSFSGRRTSLDGEFDHETAVAVCIDRERIEMWLARLVRHDGVASLGAWRLMPVDSADGVLIHGVQEILR